MKHWRFSISLDGGATWQDAEPLNGSKLTVGIARDLDAGHIFFRKKLSGQPIFGGATYAAIDAVRRDPSKRCTLLLMRLDRMCGQRQEYWRGRFSATRCTWDFNACTVTIDPQTVDRYTCIMDAMERKVNILQAPTVDGEALILPSLQLTACFSIGAVMYNCDDVSDGFTNYNEWTPAHSQVESANGDPYQLNIYWRERQRTECINGNPVSPLGTGWVLETDSCASKGTATWIRPTTISWSFGDAVRGTMVNGVPVPPDNNCLYLHVGTIDERAIDPFDNTLGLVPYFICLNAGSPVEYDRARTWRSALDLLLERSGCGLAGIRSDFFEWSPPGDAPGYAPGINYVTGEVNQMGNLVVLQKTDAIDPGASNPATIGEMNLQEALEMMRGAMRVMWDIDEDGFLRLEHWSYWRGASSFDLMTADRVNESSILQGINDQLPRYERAKWMEAQGRDFVGVDIAYDSTCADANAQEWSFGRFTTDIAFVANDPDAIAKDGFVLLATVLNGSTYSAILTQGAITGNLIVNAPLSVANLQDAFWRHDRYLPSGTMNLQSTNFEAWLPSAKQDGVSMRFCCSDLAFDATRLVNGRMARRIGLLGTIEEATLNLYTDRLSLVLKYPT